MLKSLLFTCCLLSSLLEFGYSQCVRVLDNKVTVAEAILIVQTHNDFRKLVANGKVPGQPRGVNLKKLKYDTALAAAAQKIANSCEYGHVTVNDSRWAVGQNIYMSSSTAPSVTSDWTTAIQGWFSEYEIYSYGPCCNNGPDQTGHYTQIVWANTEYVGCGYIYFEDNSLYKYNKYYVCNYGPAGNYIGRLPYKSGTSGCENLC